MKIMKFIISSISPGMFQAKNWDLKFHELTEEEFQALAMDGFSHIGHQDIAEVTGFAYNKDPVHARIGDVLLLAQKYRGVLRFYCIQVVESSTPLFREEELYIEEEMI
jgi:hypothetical protein